MKPIRELHKNILDCETVFSLFTDNKCTLTESSYEDANHSDWFTYMRGVDNNGEIVVLYLLDDLRYHLFINGVEQHSPLNFHEYYELLTIIAELGYEPEE